MTILINSGSVTNGLKYVEWKAFERKVLKIWNWKVHEQFEIWKEYLFNGKEKLSSTQGRNHKFNFK